MVSIEIATVAIMFGFSEWALHVFIQNVHNIKEHRGLLISDVIPSFNGYTVMLIGVHFDSESRATEVEYEFAPDDGHNFLRSCAMRGSVFDFAQNVNVTYSITPQRAGFPSLKNP